MTKQYVGTTLTYDVRAQSYLRTEVYMSDDPSETTELRIIEPDSEKTPKTDGCAYRRRIVRPISDQPRAGAGDSIGRDEQNHAEESRRRRLTEACREQPCEPILLRAEDRKEEGTGRQKRSQTPQTRRTDARADSDGRITMVVRDASLEDDDERPKPPPLSACTLDGIPFVNNDEPNERRC